MPLPLVNLLLGAFIVKLTDSVWGQAGLMLAGNLILVGITILILNRVARDVREAPALKTIAAVER